MSTQGKQVIIGYGNGLRGDDGVGPAAADVVRSWQIPGVRVVIRQQLLPELIAELRDAERVLFIDAAADGDAAFTLRMIEASPLRRTLGHYQTPGDLLSLLRDLDGRVPEAWLATISASSLDHREGLSRFAHENMLTALARIRTWLEEQSCTKSA